MAEIGLRKLKRRELLKMLLVQCEETERLQRELERLTERHEEMSESYERLKVKLNVKDERLNQKDIKLDELKKKLDVKDERLNQKDAKIRELKGIIRRLIGAHGHSGTDGHGGDKAVLESVLKMGGLMEDEQEFHTESGKNPVMHRRFGVKQGHRTGLTQHRQEAFREHLKIASGGVHG